MLDFMMDNLFQYFLYSSLSSLISSITISNNLLLIIKKSKLILKYLDFLVKNGGYRSIFINLVFLEEKKI